MTDNIIKSNNSNLVSIKDNKPKDNQNKTKLKKILEFKDVYFIGLGYIIGAGIYSLLHLTTKKSKEFTWLSFLIGGFISLCTAYSYINLNNEFDSNSTEYDYFTNILNNSDIFKLFLIIILLLKGIFVSSTLSVAFGDLGQGITNFPSKLITAALIFSIALFNVFDLKLTVDINTFFTIVETSVLVILIIFGSSKIKFNQIFTSKINISGVCMGAFLSVFAFSGFEGIPKLNEEIKDSNEVVPKAINYSLITSIILYVLTSIVVNSILDVPNVIKSPNPISSSYKSLFNQKYGLPVNILTMASIFNTILLTVLFLSRQLYGISIKNKLKAQKFKNPIFKSINDLLDLFGNINKTTQTPIYSILFISTMILIITYIGNINSLNYLSNLFLFLIYILVNLSSLRLSLKKHKVINKYSVIGLLSSVIMIFLTYFN